MFLSWQTYEGFQISARSTIKCTKFLLSEGMEYVLTERFCQDPVEEYFGKQRQFGRRCDNPDIRTFGYNSNTIRIERSVSCQSGNTRGRKDTKKAWVNVTNEKLPCRKKQRTVQRIHSQQRCILSHSIHTLFLNFFTPIIQDIHVTIN